MTPQQMIDRAKTLIEAEIEGIIDPTWTAEMLEQWYQDAQDDIVLKVVNEKLYFLYTTSTTITTSGEHVRDTDFVKLILATRANKSCFPKTIEQSKNSLFNATTEFPTVYLKEDKIIIEPLDTADAQVIYIRKPKFELNTESEIPKDWQYLIPNYICAKALQKDKQETRANYYKTLFDEGITVINGKNST
ncbi:MAG: hypothetical protein AB1567_04495 [bacterium]